MKKKDSLGDRMKKNYEEAYKIYLPMRIPVIIRLDGKNFHTFTRKMERPFDEGFILSMAELSGYLYKEIQGAVFCYTQSDEISILVHNYKRLTSDSYYANEIQKMVSISAGLASAFMSHRYGQIVSFDSRTFVLPESEVVNYFIWRQQDASRNSIQMLGRAHYSHKELNKKNTKDIHEMLHQKGVNWNDLDDYKKRGFAVYKTSEVEGHVDLSIPIFTQDREFIQKHLEIIES